MKRKLLNWIRILLVAAVIIALFYGFMQVYGLHMRSFPQHYANSAITNLIPFVAALVLFPLPPIVRVQLARRGGYRLYWMQLLFLEVCRGGKVKLRFNGRIRLGMLMLPPRTDGTSPYRLYLLAMPLILLGSAVLLALLAALLWETAAFLVLFSLALMSLVGCCVLLLPNKNGDSLSLFFALNRHPELVRTCECSAYISAALSDGMLLADMPEDWFISEPPVLTDSIHVQVHTINSASWLIQHQRFADAYALLRPLFDLQPAPENHQSIACTILNGAICEALADLPPMCLNKLDHPSVQYMTPAAWQGRLLTAKYARALLLEHDEAAADALLKECEALSKNDARDANIVRLLQEKAGRNMMSEEEAQ